MQEFRVTWTINVSAETPERAAELALEIQRDQHSTATVFDVASQDGEQVSVDLIAL